MPASSSLRGRVPAQVAMSEVVAAQLDVPNRSRVARLFGKSPLTAATRPMYRAALGELLVGDMLDTLGPKWDVLHVVPLVGSDDDGDDHGLGDQDIDHLVIGPPGVFAIITENFPGQELKVNGESLLVGNRHFDDIQIVRGLGDRAAQRLSAAVGKPVAVRPLLVAVTPTKLVLREQPAGVCVVTSKQLLHHLEEQPLSLSGADVASISDVADRNTTWLATPNAAQDPQKLGDTFAALRAEVRDAAQARLFWGVVGFVVLATCIWVSTAMIASHLMGR